MSDTIERYTLEDAEGKGIGGVYEDYRQAREDAMAEGLRVIEHHYEWYDSEMVDDFTKSEEPEDWDGE